MREYFMKTKRTGFSIMGGKRSHPVYLCCRNIFKSGYKEPVGNRAS